METIKTGEIPMKNFVARHSTGILVSVTVLFLAVCSLCAYLYLDFRADSAAAESQEYLYETLFRTSVRRLEAALNEENRMTSYHFALTAAENAASAGRGTEASFFRKISTGIADGAENMNEIAEAVVDYMETGTVPEGFSILYETSEESVEDLLDSEPASVSYFRRQAAEECAASVTGADGILRPAEKSRAGEFVYTCRNAYAVVDARSGSPIEAGVSMAPGEVRLSEAECAGYAQDFLREYFPPDIARAAVLISAVPEAGSGTYEFTYRSGGREIKLAVRRDTGRIVRLVAR